MTSELDKAAREILSAERGLVVDDLTAADSQYSRELKLIKAGHARGVADERERADGLVRALRHSLSWGESMYGRLVAGHKDDINWTAIEEARRTLAEYEDRNARP